MEALQNLYPILKLSVQERFDIMKPFIKKQNMIEQEQNLYILNPLQPLFIQYYNPKTSQIMRFYKYKAEIYYVYGSEEDEEIRIDLKNQDKFNENYLHSMLKYDKDGSYRMGFKDLVLTSEKSKILGIQESVKKFIKDTENKIELVKQETKSYCEKYGFE